MPALSRTLIISMAQHGATSERLMYLLHHFASHSFRSSSPYFFTFIHASRLLGLVRPLAYYWLHSSILSNLDPAGFL